MPKSNETGTTVSLRKNIAAAETRHSSRSSKKTSSQSTSFLPQREDDRGLKSYSLFTSVVGSKMSNLSHHNYPPTDPFALHSHIALQTKCFDFQTAGYLRLPPHKIKEAHCLLVDKMMTTCILGRPPRYVFWPSCSRSRPLKKPPSNHLQTQKGAIGHYTPSDSKYI